MIKDYIKHLRKNNYSLNTITTYKSVLGIYEEHLNDIRRIKQHLHKYFKSPNTVWTHFNILCSYMTWAKDKRIVQLKEFKLPKISQVYMEVFTKDYVTRKTRINDTDNDHLINMKITIKFLFETGLRASELKTIISYNKKIVRLKGKGNKIREVFHNYETTVRMKPFDFSTKTLRLWVKSILGDKFTPHSIRRSHATHLLLRGASPKMVMNQLGHEKIETTFRYMQLSINANKKIYDKYF